MNNMIKPCLKQKGGYMFMRIFNRRVINADAIFRDHYIDVKAFYVHEFNIIPCIAFIGELNITEAFAHITDVYRQNSITTFQHTYFDHEAGKMFFNNTIFVLDYERMIELSGNYCQVLYRSDQHAWAVALLKQLAAYRIEATVPAAPATIVGFARQTTMN